MSIERGTDPKRLSRVVSIIILKGFPDYRKISISNFKDSPSRRTRSLMIYVNKIIHQKFFNRHQIDIKRLLNETFLHFLDCPYLKYFKKVRD